MSVNRMNYLAQNSPSFSLLTEDQLYDIHSASLEVLERSGVRVDSEEALSLLEKAGGYLEDGNIVKIPTRLVEQSLNSAPSRFVLADREGNRAMWCEKNRSYFGPGSDLPVTVDFETGELRASRKKDVIRAARVVDALSNYDFMMSYGIATDVSDQLSYLHQFQAMVENTTKPIVFTARDSKDFDQILQMASTIRGGYDELRQNPFLACYSEPTSPLIHSREAVDKLLGCADYGIPVIYAPGAGAGTTAPSTLAGLLTQVNAEILSGIVIHQLRKRGAPFVYGAACTSTDMRTTIMPHGAPEFPMLGAAFAQLSRYYDLPSWSTAGNSDAVIPDQQASIEWTNSLLLAELSGANIVHDVGYLGTGLVGALESFPICNEIMGVVRYVGKGIRVDSETLATEVIDRVGPGGHYLTDDHTLRHFKKEFSSTELFNRERYVNWEKKGKVVLREKAKSKVRKILDNHEPVVLDKEIGEELSAIISRAEEEYS